MRQVDPLKSFSDDQRRALVSLREDYQRGIDPARSRPPFEVRWNLTLALSPADAVAVSPPRHWRCLLGRTTEDGELRELVTIFCVTREHPAPPTLREVIQTLAVGVAHWMMTVDLSSWAARYRINLSGQTTEPCYRGVIRMAYSDAAFVASLREEHRALIALLGPTGFTELMKTVGMDDHFIHSYPFRRFC